MNHIKNLYDLLEYEDFKNENDKNLFEKGTISIRILENQVDAIYKLSENRSKEYCSLSKEQFCSIIFFSRLKKNEQKKLMIPAYTDKEIDDYCRVFTEEDFVNDDKELSKIKNLYNDFVIDFYKMCNSNSLIDFINCR